MHFVDISPIHDHGESHSFMKVLKGMLRETKYKWPEEENAPMEEKGSTNYYQNQVSYINSETKSYLNPLCETC